MNFQPAASLTEQIADHLSREIVTGQLRSGARIQELKVAKQLGVSRGSVREALIMLQGRHLIDILPRRGAVVCAQDRQALTDLFEVISSLFGLLFQRLALAGADVGPMRATLEESEELPDAEAADAAQLMLTEFVHAAIEAANRPLLGELLLDLIPAYQRATYSSLRQSVSARSELIGHLRAIADAAARADCRATNENVLRWLGRAREMARPQPG